MPPIHFKKKLRQMSDQEILKAYKSGERNFSGIDCKEGYFAGQNLHGADFSDSDLRFSGWKDAKLNGCNFSGSDLQWSSFERAEIKGAVFRGANISNSVLNNSIVDEKTDMTKSDLSYTLLFNVNWGAVKNHGADTANAAFTPAEITEEGLIQIRGNLALMKNVSDEVKILTNFSVNTAAAQAKKVSLDDNSSSVSYHSSDKGGMEGYSSINLGGENNAYQFHRKKKHSYSP